MLRISKLAVSPVSLGLYTGRQEDGLLLIMRRTKNVYCGCEGIPENPVIESLKLLEHQSHYKIVLKANGLEKAIGLVSSSQKEEAERWIKSVVETLGIT